MDNLNKKITLWLEKEEIAMLDKLCQRFDEGHPDLIKRAIIMLYYDLYKNEKKL